LIQVLEYLSRNMGSIRGSLEKLPGDYLKEASLLKFEGIEGKDIYNPSKPFKYKDSLNIATRVEPREDECKSEIVFFKKREDCWYKNEDLASLPNSQDPFVARIGDELIIGAVEISCSGSKINYKTVFLDKNLEKIAEVEGMKCVRITELPGSEIGVFLRPKGSEYGMGKICYTTIDSLEELERINLCEAKLIDILPKNMWGGVNDIYQEDEKLLVLGHAACFSGDGSKNYYCIVFEFDYETEEASKPKVAVSRDAFQKTEAKRKELRNVVYPGGFEVKEEVMEIFLGISDAYAGKAVIKNPFKQY